MLRAEREKRITEVQKDLKLQIFALTKKNAALLKVVEAKKKGMAVQSRDLAELNMNFLNSVGALSDDIIASEKNTASVKKVEEKYLKVNYRM